MNVDFCLAVVNQKGMPAHSSVVQGGPITALTKLGFELRVNTASCDHTKMKETEGPETELEKAINHPPDTQVEPSEYCSLW